MKKSFLDTFFNFMADPEGLSQKDIKRELRRSGINVRRLKKRVFGLIGKNKRR